jgi:hypothetical protein
MHSAHSLETGSPTKASRKNKRNESTPEYLDLFPQVADSGIKRNKGIVNNPLTLEQAEIDPLLREDHKSLPSLR